MIQEIRKKYVVFAAAICALAVSCSGERVADQAVIPLGLSIGEVRGETLGANVVKSHRIIPLETSDSVLLSERPIISDISERHILMTDQGTVWFFDPVDGSLISKFNRRGNGPGEYLFIFSAAIDPAGEKVYILDNQKRMVNVYTPQGRSLEQFPNDSITFFTIDREGRFIASNRTFDKWRTLVGIYDNDWTPLASHLYNPPLDGRNVRLWPSYPVNIFNGDPHIARADTLFRISTESATPVLVLDKGSLRAPEELTLTVGRDKEKETYIMGDYGYLAGDYYFCSYYYRRTIYYDLWRASTGELIGRNVRTGPEQPEGLAFELDGKRVHAWPRYVKGNKIYCFLILDQAASAWPEYDENDNPLILEIEL